MMPIRAILNLRTLLPALAALALVFSGTATETRAARKLKVRVLERGFRTQLHDQCGYQGPVPEPGSPGDRPRDRLTDIECSPGGPWGNYVYLAYTWSDVAYETAAGVERVDFSGNSEPFIYHHYDMASTYLGFSPLGWGGGDLLFETIVPGCCTPTYSSHIVLYDPLAQSQGSYYRIQAPVGAAAADIVGDFDFDLFYQAGMDYFGGERGIIRVDETGAETVFSDAIFSEMRFGPGGDWGGDLYGQGQTIDPSGVATPFPVPFWEFDWVSGPGFGGDMFARVAGEDDGTIFRVLADGTMTPFVRNVSGPLCGCNDALWVATADGCVEIRQRTRGPRPNPRALR